MRKVLGGLLAIVLSAPSAHAWNSFGHMTVAAIAYDNLSSSAKVRVTELLKHNPNYSDWIAGTSNDTRDKVAFMRAATWPDYIKHAEGYKNDGEVPKSVSAARNTGYSDKLMHRYWHYIDLPFSSDHTALIQPKKPNAQTQIANFRKTLADKNASDPLKSYDLVWLIHLVGDVHQPLHATSRFTHDEPQGDRGGNDVALCKKPCRKELHAFWDDVLGTSNDPQKVITYADKISAPPTTAAANSDEDKWIQESFDVAKKSVYIAPIGAGVGPYTLTKGYRATARAAAKRRVALAGVRLANMINKNLKD